MSESSAGEVVPPGVTAATALGRTHEEASPPGTDPFEFDLRRIIGCAAFRRLQYKTQVFVSPQGDHFRTRLTHTLEVASMARQLARQLGIHVALAEAVALAHDLGHPPFGHAGETALHELMSAHGGFEHNAQSLRVVEYLEHPFPPFRGLNLTYEVREALARHRTAYDHPAGIETEDPALDVLLRRGMQPTLEAQVVAVADRIAYDVHDLEDGLGAGLLDAASLEGLGLWEQAAREMRERYPDRSIFALRRGIFEKLQHLLMDDVVGTTRARVRAAFLRTVEDVRAHDQPVVAFSDDLARALAGLESFLRERVYGHADVRKLDDMAARLTSHLFRAHVDDPAQMPRRFQERLAGQGVHRVVCDYIAGMTDRYCENEYKRIYMPFAQEGRA